jgi:GAF domain
MNTELTAEQKRLQAIQQITRGILAEKPPDEIAKIALMQLDHLISAQYAVVVLFNQQTEGKIITKNNPENLAILVNMNVPIAEFYQRGILENGAIFYIPDLTSVKNLPLELKKLYLAGIRSFLSLPLFVQGILVGELNFADHRIDWLNTDTEIIREIGYQLAIMLKNTQLITQIKTEKNRLSKLKFDFIESQDKQNQQLSQELNYQLGEQLKNIKNKLQNLSGENTGEKIPAIMNIIDQIRQKFRPLYLEIRPLILDELGLASAIRWYIEQKLAKSAAIAEFKITPITADLSPEFENICFRIVQEGLINISQDYPEQKIIFELGQIGEQLFLKVSNHQQKVTEKAWLGKTIKTDKLELLADKVLLLGGEFNIKYEFSRITEIHVRLPLKSGLVPEIKTKQIGVSPGKNH